MTAEQLGRTRKILDGARYVTLATASAEGEPWSAPVHYEWFAKPLRLVFSSTVDSRHGRDIAARPEVAGSLFITGVATDVAIASVDGAQFSGRCTEVPVEELPEYHDRFFRAALPDPAMRAEWALPESAFRSPGVHRLYVVAVEHWWIVDPTRWAEDKIDRRVEVPAAELSTLDGGAT